MHVPLPSYNVLSFANKHFILELYMLQLIVNQEPFWQLVTIQILGKGAYY